MKDKITAVITLEKVRYYNQLNNFGIICANVIEADEEIQKDKYGKMIVKGIMPEPQPGIKYNLYASYVVDEKWGNQYEVISMYTNLNIDVNDVEGQKEFLKVLFTDNQVDAMYEALENPYMTLYNKDATSLV